MSQQQGERAENLRELLRQHWLHCRHLEYQRTWFLLAYLGSIASILGFVYFGTGLEWTIAIPMSLTVFALLLTKRWSDAFEYHRRIVSELATVLWTESGGEELTSLTMDIPVMGIFKILRIRTTRLFYSFYFVILIGLIVLLLFS